MIWNLIYHSLDVPCWSNLLSLIFLAHDSWSGTNAFIGLFIEHLLCHRHYCRTGEIVANKINTHPQGAYIQVQKDCLRRWQKCYWRVRYYFVWVVKEGFWIVDTYVKLKRSEGESHVSIRAKYVSGRRVGTCIKPEKSNIFSHLLHKIALRSKWNNTRNLYIVAYYVYFHCYCSLCFSIQLIFARWTILCFIKREKFFKNMQQMPWSWGSLVKIHFISVFKEFINY